MEPHNQDIRFEGRDTNNRAITVLGLIVLSVLFAISLLVIPLTQYLWDWAGHNNPSSAAVQQPDSASGHPAPQVTLEVLPGAELQQFRKEVSAENSDKKIATAMKEALEQGFPSRQS